MEVRAMLAPGLPRAHPTKSYWQDPADLLADYRSTIQLPENADTVIIGSGVSGCSIANNILDARHGADVVLLEARQAASGASGRNGGHTKPASYRTFADNVKLVGKEDAIRIARLEYKCMLSVHEFARDNGIQCDSRRHDTVDVFYDQTEWQRAQESVVLLREMAGADDPAAKYTFHDPEETSSSYLAPKSLGSLSYEAGSLNAYKFTIGVLKLALQKGLNLQTNTAVKSIVKVKADGQAAHWLVNTARGMILARKLVLATNGYTAHLYSPLQGIIVPFRGIITAQRPGKNLPQTGLSTSFSYIYEDGFEYMITRPAGSLHQGDIIIGGGDTKTEDGGLGEYGQTDDTVLNNDILRYLTGCTADYFGKDNWGADHAAGRARQAWSGIMGYSADGYPLIGPVPGEEGLFINASFQGHGMVLCFLSARAAAAMVLGTEREAALNEWFPKCYQITRERMQLEFRG